MKSILKKLKKIIAYIIGIILGLIFLVIVITQYFYWTNDTRDCHRIRYLGRDSKGRKTGGSKLICPGDLKKGKQEIKKNSK